MKIVIIGAGPGGYVAAIKAAIMGAEVIVVEKSKLGGTCLNWGCVPTKSLLAASERVEMVRDAEEFGINISSDITIDFNKIMGRKNKIVSNLVKGIEVLFTQRKITLIKGLGKIISANEIQVTKEDGTTESINADNIIIATGSAPIVPPMFAYDKIKVITSDSITKVEIIDDMVTATLGSGKSLTADIMLVSVGRRPYVDNLGVEELGLASERGKLIVDENMMTNVSGIYAIGDVINSPMLAHVASKEGLVAIDHAMGKKSSVNYDAVPRCVYTDPEVAAVGKTERELTEKGITYHVGSFEFRGLGKAQAIGKLQGSVKILVDENDVIVGASVVGPHATDLLTELTLAVHFKLTAAQVGDVIHPHPTLSEALMEALHDVHGQCVHKV